jgi:hypothetical protein
MVDRVVSLYFEGINNNDPSMIPLANDVEFNGPMLSEPLRGSAVVRKHISETAPFVARLDQKQLIIEGENAAVVVEFEGVNGVIVEGAEVFRVRDGEINLKQSFFDVRPLFRGGS